MPQTLSREEEVASTTPPLQSPRATPTLQSPRDTEPLGDTTARGLGHNGRGLARARSLTSASSSSCAAQNSFLVNDVLAGEENTEQDDDGSVRHKAHAGKKRGWLTGVFVPTCENMWGVLIFLRFYTIIGQAGVLQTLIAVTLSFIAALCTTSSMSSIASSGGIASGGGPYHMISRALGPVVGISVGIMYWLAITLLSVLEVLGAVEALAMAVPSIRFWGHMQAIGSGCLACLALFVYGGINVVTKLGVFFAIVVFYTIFSYYFGLFTAPHHDLNGDNGYITGISRETFLDNWSEHYDSGIDFGTVLSLFYPCFTGILSGANRASTLKDPPRDLRIGTFAAVCFSYVMYVTLFLLWGSVADYRYLQGDVDAYGNETHFGHGRRLSGGDAEVGAQVVNNIVWQPFPYSAFIGIIISSLSQSLQCLVVAPRLLQQMASDKILTILNPFAGLSSRGEPHRALFFTYGIGALLVLIGQLDLVAPLLSMCFLVAYAFINFACFVLTWLKSPAWRPRWIAMRRWRVWFELASSLGFVVCLTIMLLINPIWAAGAWALALFLWIYVNFKITARDWGSAMDGIKYQLALHSLIGLESSQRMCVNWRPQVLIMYRINIVQELNGIKHREILNFYNQLRKSRGFCVVACVLTSPRRDERVMKRAQIEKGIIKGIMQEEGIYGFAEVVVAPTWAEGMPYIIQLTGIGGLVPNTVMLDWPENWQQDHNVALEFASVVSTALMSDKAVMAVKGLRVMPTETVHGTIDIWWMIHDGGLLVLLSWLLSQHRTWRSCHLRVFTVAENVSKERAEKAAEMLTRTLKQRRLFEVDVEVILLDNSLIEPYTYDWTLRVEDRRQFLQQLNPNKGKLESIPLEIDDLFEMEEPQASASRGAPTPSFLTPARSAPRTTASRSEVASDPNNSPDGEGRIVVSDIRSEVGTHSPTRRRRSASQLPMHCSSCPCITDSNSNNGVPARSVASSVSLPSTSKKATFAKNIRDTFLLDPLVASDTAERAEDTPRRQPWESLQTGEQLGGIIFSRSKRAQLVVMNLPNMWGTEGEEVQNCMRYCDRLTQGLERVLFVHSTGHEVFDI